MSGAPPIVYVWDGDVFSPIPVHRARADYHLVAGDRYTLEAVHQRSRASHNHYMARVDELWRNLPEDHGLDRWVDSAEHLRKYALIKTGWYDSHTLVAKDSAEAQRFAAFCRPIDAFSLVTVEGNVVTRYVAKSQSYKDMGKEDFENSKHEVLNFLEGIVGVQPHEEGNAA